MCALDVHSSSRRRSTLHPFFPFTFLHFTGDHYKTLCWQGSLGHKGLPAEPLTHLCPFSGPVRVFWDRLFFNTLVRLRAVLMCLINNKSRSAKHQWQQWTRKRKARGRVLRQLLLEMSPNFRFWCALIGWWVESKKLMAPYSIFSYGKFTLQCSTVLLTCLE